MLVDSRQVAAGSRIAVDVCIVGSGPAGITLARELRGQGLEIAVLESGGLDLDPAIDALSTGELDAPIRNPDYLTASRARVFGGASQHWTGTCRPLDDIDFEARSWVPLSGWPLRRDELDDHYDRAAAILDCPRFRHHRGDGEVAPVNPIHREPEPRLVPKAMYVSKPPPRLGDRHRRELADARDVRVFLYANATRLVTDEDGRQVLEVPVAVLDGPRFSLQPRICVLAAGGFENARLLLLSEAFRPGGPGNRHDVVGRYFTEHPKYYRAALMVWSGRLPASGPLAASRGWLSDERYVVYTPSGRAQRQDRLLNCGVRARPVNPPADRLLREVDRVASVIDGPAANRTILTGLILYTEQVPVRTNRVTLAADRDRLGLHKVRLEWRNTAEQTDHLVRFLRFFAREVAIAGRGRVQIFLDRDLPVGRPHPSSTTRMCTDPRYGVTDGDARVHGTENLFVAGSSLFPTGGFANPTLTLVALALRLADHLKALRQARSGPWR